MTKDLQILISCEHGGNRVPERYRHLFHGFEPLLQTHRGYDIGILPFAEFLAAEFATPLISADVTRLLIDLNRSSGSRTLFSEISRHLSPEDKKDILARYHDPYWRAVADMATGIIASGRRALHLSIHSFTPVFSGEIRNAGLGLLYDPKRSEEKVFCLAWQTELYRIDPTLRIRRNYPYKGNADALVTALRKRFSAEDYLGIELEINQRYPLSGSGSWVQLQEQLVQTLRRLLESKFTRA
ncbi:MAG: N-formylglutamate amidohydrolase [Syntrophotaleaceae bacterium]